MVTTCKNIGRRGIRLYKGTAKKTDKEFQDFLSDYIKEPILGGSPSEDNYRLVKKTDRKKIKKNDFVFIKWPHVAGVPLTYWSGDQVITKDGRKGVVEGSIFLYDLVIFEKGKPSAAHFVVKVNFGDYIEYHVREDLSGKRIDSSSDVEIIKI